MDFSGELMPVQTTVSTRTRQRGFTLIEIMVVIIILGVLAALVVPNIMGAPDEARAKAATVDIARVMRSLDQYRLDNLKYPSTEQGLLALVQRPGGKPEPRNWKQVLKSEPKDPWGRPYLYLNPGANGDIDVFSYGADGEAGGEGVDADIGSWQLNQ
jgi:general secretion pathway protein G